MSNKYAIRPFVGLGELRLGTRRDVCRAQLGSGWTEFSRTGSRFKETDAFSDLGLYLEYNQEDLLQFIEAAPPASVSYSGVSLLDRPVPDVVAELGGLGLASVSIDQGLAFPEGGFLLYAPGNVVEAVSVHAEGYFDDDSDDLA